MDEELIEFKRKQKEAIRKERFKDCPSIVESFGLPLVESKSDDNPSGDDYTPRKCVSCNGKRYVQGLFSKSECFACDGTGFDLIEPIEVIKHLVTRLDNSIQVFANQRQTIKFLEQFKPSDEELRAHSVQKFYEGGRRVD